MDNGLWAHFLIDQLIEQGVVDFCIAPGSRSTPLALAAARHPKAQAHVHFDERSLGFFALGIAIAKQTSAVLIVTSGTAVGNLLPCIMEAYHSHVPLIVLTADRPPELRDCSASQATDQIKIFQNFTLWQSELPCPDTFQTEDFIRSQASELVWRSMQKGPVHLNCAFREPLYTQPEIYSHGSEQPLFYPVRGINPDAVSCCQNLLKKPQRGFILIGRMPPGYDLAPIFDFAHQLKWPILADILSGARCHPKIDELIVHFDRAIQLKVLPKPDMIVHFGGTLLSKAATQWIKEINAPTIHIHPHIERIDPLHCRPVRICADPASFCQAIQNEKSNDSKWLNECQSIDRQMQAKIDGCFASPHPWTEADMMRELGKHLPDDWSVFLGNSMPIRDADHFFFPCSLKGIYANRGLAGIDGQIATAVGIATETQSPLLAILGDQSCLHDLSSISLLKKINTPFLLVISNNFGGGIFSRLSVAQEPKHFELLFGAEHAFRFHRIAEMFDIPYQSFDSAIKRQVFSITKPAIVEVLTSRKENACFEKRFLEKCFRKENVSTDNSFAL